MDRKSRIGIIGFGEAGYEFAKSFKRADYEVVIYDVLIEKKPDVIIERAKSISVEAAEHLNQLVSKVDAIFIFTSSTVCIKIAEKCAANINDDQFYVDCNSASPEIKQKIWKALSYHPRFVDLAVMGPVPGKGIKVPMTISGPGAIEFEKQFHDLNKEIQIIDEEPGSAALIKLTRSSFMKGLAALLLETIALSETNKVTEPVLDSLVKTLGKDFEPLITRLVRGTFQHAARREKEVEAVLALQDSVDQQKLMSSSTKQILQLIANYNKIDSEKKLEKIEDYFPHILKTLEYKDKISI